MVNKVEYFCPSREVVTLWLVGGHAARRHGVFTERSTDRRVEKRGKAMEDIIDINIISRDLK